MSELTGRPVQLVEGDLRNAALLDQLFAEASASGQPIEAVIHFAGLKAVGESVAEPLLYWDVNLAAPAPCSRPWMPPSAERWCLAAAPPYGCPETVPISEVAPIQPINPYGHSKAAVNSYCAM